MINVLVTGSEGFVGKELTAYLNSSDNHYKVFGIDRKIGTEVLDITEDYLVSNHIDIVVHLAAQTSVWNDDLMLIENDNIRSFIHIFMLAKKLNLRFVYASSSCSINITSMYGLSKQFDDVFAELYGWDKCIGLRFHNVYGKSSRENTLLGICMNNDTVTLYNSGNNVRHFTFVGDVCTAVEKSFSIQSGLYNVVNPEEYSTKQFCEEVSNYKSLKIVYTPQIRELDKSEQHIDKTHTNLIDNATSISEGLKQIFSHYE